jgi:hypothetical protein
MQVCAVHRTKRLPYNDFYNYRTGRYAMRGELLRDALNLMERLGIPLGQEEYSANTCVPLVIDLWNDPDRSPFDANQYRFKCFIFGALGFYKAKYEYGDPNYNTPIILYHNDRHFDAVQSLNGLFGGRNYCLSCQCK